MTKAEEDIIIEAVAEAWASMDGKIASFLVCKGDPIMEERDGYHQGYLSDAQELIDRMKKRGVALSWIGSGYAENKEIIQDTVGKELEGWGPEPNDCQACNSPNGTPHKSYCRRKVDR